MQNANANKFCANCGEQRADGANFCSNCGGATHKDEAKMTQPNPRKLSKRTTGLILASGVLVIGVSASVGISSMINTANEEARQAELERIEQLNKENARKARQEEIAIYFAEVADFCSRDGDGVDLGTDFLVLDHRGQDEFSGLSFDELDCFFGELNVPEYEKNRMLKTRSLDGNQDASWDGEEGDYQIEANWTYHPDDGLDIAFKLVSELLDDYEEPEVDSEAETS
jgi:hypothetical protein